MKELNHDAKEVLSINLEDLKQRIIDNHERANQRTTGATAKSMFVQVDRTSGGISGILFGRPFFAALETGTKPWRNQYLKPPKFFIELIQGWINLKGIQLPAGAVARVLMERGSSLYRSGGRTDIFSNEIPLTIERISDSLFGLFDTEVESINNNSQ